MGTLKWSCREQQQAFSPEHLQVFRHPDRDENTLQTKVCEKSRQRFGLKGIVSSAQLNDAHQVPVKSQLGAPPRDYRR